MAEAGRPTKMTNEVLAKLREGFLRGYTDEESCLFAEINPTTLYRYQEDNPDYASEKEQWKKNPILEAKHTVLSGIKRDPKLALDYLKSKARDEFSVKTETDLTTNGKDINPVLVKFIDADNRDSS